MGAYILKRSSDKSNTEYLIFVREENNVPKLFLSYSEDFSKAIYSPGVLYGVNPVSKEVKLYNFPSYFYTPEKGQVQFALKNVENVTLLNGSRMGYDNIEYIKNIPSQEDELGLSLPYSSTALEVILTKNKSL